MAEGKYINGYKRARPSLGVMREHNVQINMLPEVGEIVMVEEMLVRCRRLGEQHVISAYHQARAYLDVWGRPKAMLVAGYTKGIENPLDPDNYVELEWELPGGSYGHTNIKTVLIATGSMRLVPYPEEESVEEGRFLCEVLD